MSTRLKRRGFTLVELVVVLFIIGLAIALLLPALCGSRNGPSNRNSCFNKLRQIGLALDNYQNAKGHFPLVCFDAPPLADPARDCRPGDASGGPHTTGYSWLVEILPELEEGNLYRAISDGSGRFSAKTGPFTPSITYGNAQFQHPSCVTLPVLICPTWAGDGYNNSFTTIDVGPAAGAPSGYGAPEYAGIDTNTPGVGENAFKGKVAPTNYKAMVGTHMRDGVPVENGGMRLTGPRGLSIRDGDYPKGTSRTILVCETKESAYASWYDGTLNWLVGNDPNQPAPGANDQSPWNGASLAINRGFNPASAGSVPYLKTSLTANSPQNDVWWGPSSDHPGGIVSHVLADGSIMGITDQCDPKTYLSLITRAGSEPIDDSKIQ